VETANLKEERGKRKARHIMNNALPQSVENEKNPKYHEEKQKDAA
jgi:hypothetical protein